MKISSRLDYALSCVLVLADLYELKKPVPAAIVAKREKLAVDYVEKILGTLKKSNIVKSIRGVKGGYILNSSPDKISAKDVFVAMQQKQVLKLVCDRDKGRRKDCIHLPDCRIKEFWIGLRKDMTKYLNKYSLEDLLKLRRKEKNWLL